MNASCTYNSKEDSRFSIENVAGLNGTISRGASKVKNLILRVVVPGDLLSDPRRTDQHKFMEDYKTLLTYTSKLERFAFWILKGVQVHFEIKMIEGLVNSFSTLSTLELKGL